MLIPLLSLAVLVTFQTGQPASGPPTFDTASVTSASSREIGTFFHYLGGRFYAKGATLRTLIRSAYGVQDAEIVGGPEWMNTGRFNIEAKGDVGESPSPMVAHAGGPSRLQLMMQALLADRFQLVVHRARQESNIYALVRATADGSPGPALRRSDVDCEALAVEARRSPARPRTQPGRCDLGRDAGSLTIGGRPIAQLVSSLSTIVGRPVVDETELAGNFDIRLKWSPDQVVPPASLGPALRDQLGLDLVARRRPADVLVVDRAERPVDR